MYGCFNATIVYGFRDGKRLIKKMERDRFL